MKTVLSHLVQKQFSSDYENIATEALAYLLQNHEPARHGFLKILRAVMPLPDLHFQTQHTEENMRPDIWGFDRDTLRVFIENKFWAGLTENQPIEYLNLLAKYHQDGLLLIVVPAARQESIWRELLQRLKEKGISFEKQASTGDITRLVKTGAGPFLLLTSWTKILASIDNELADELSARNDLLQLRSLCEIAESDAFIPLSSAELTNQRTPAIISQVVKLSQRAFDIGLTEGFFSKDGVAFASTYERVGRYVKFPLAGKVCAWFGVSFPLWQKHGGSPLWLSFSNSQWCRAPEVRVVIEPWAKREGKLTVNENSDFAINIKIATGEEFDQVVRDIVRQIKAISSELMVLPEAQSPGSEVSSDHSSDTL